MINDPIVTIAVPFYNEDKYLKQTLQSLVDQTLKNIVIILSDNNSNDDSSAIASEFAKDDARIKLIKHQTNIGAVGNFVYTRDISNTKYFMWLGAHDCLKNNFVEEAVNFLESNSDVVLYYPKSCFFENYGVWLDNADSDIQLNSVSPINRMMKVAESLGMCTAIHGMFRADMLKELPFDQKGVDHLILFLAASYGRIESSQELQYYRRVVRKETHEEFIKRMKDYKIGNASDVNNYKVDVNLSHFKYIHQNPRLNLKQKIELVSKLRDLFTFRIPKSFTWLKLYQHFLLKSFNPQTLMLFSLTAINELLGKLKRIAKLK
jgi:glycosyltransferase involved in cell wall biosynthesis